MIPLVHDFADETVLVFGGGSVGARKARRFAREADVVVVSPAFVDEAFEPTSHDHSGTVELVRAAPDPDDVAAWIERTDPALVVAATDDPAVNEAAAAAGREHGALANRADHSGERAVGDVAVPATVRDDPVVVAISTGGASPALAGALRERLDDELDGAGELATLTADLRERLRDDGVPAADRRDAVRAVTRSSSVWTALRAGNPNPGETAEDVVADVLEDP